MYIQRFTTVVDLPEFGCVMEVSTMFYICRYCVFTRYGREPVEYMRGRSAKPHSAAFWVLKKKHCIFDDRLVKKTITPVYEIYDFDTTSYHHTWSPFLDFKFMAT